MILSILFSTNDPTIKSQIESSLLNQKYKFSFEPMNHQTLLKLLEQKTDLLVFDVDEDDSELDIIQIIRKTRPQLPIVVLSKDNSTEILRKYTEVGVFYCIIKPFKIWEMEKILEAVVVSKNRRKQYSKMDR